MATITPVCLNQREARGSTLTFVKDLRRYEANNAMGDSCRNHRGSLQSWATASSRLTQIDLRLNLGWLPLAAIATITANLLLPLGWRQIIASFNHSLAPGRAVRVWCLAQTARYFPTGLLAIASRLKLATKEGISKSVTATSIAIETAILFSWAALICALFVPSTTFPTLVRWLGGTVAAVGLTLTPWAVPTVGKLLAKTKHFELPAPKPPLLSQATGLLGASVAIRAAGTLCLAAGFFNSTTAA